MHALQTVRRLPRTGSSRPPPSARLALYGLYKQSMEGDVAAILPRPTLPPSSPDPASSSVHKYASRDLRTRETAAEIEKWDAWNACTGMSCIEAKRRYITTLIETMKIYASGTPESRELVSELEFVWGQIRSQSASSEEGGDSPTRRLERSGLRGVEIPGGSRDPPNTEAGVGDRSKLRVLSPVSSESGEIVEGQDVTSPEPPVEDDGEEGEEVFRDAPDGSKDNVLDRRRAPSAETGEDEDPIRNRKWRRRIEEALTKMTAEIAALREQMSDSRVFGAATARRRFGLWAWIRWLVWAALRQMLVDAVLLGVLVLWGRWRGDRRAEEWLRRRWREMSAFLSRWTTIWSKIWPGSYLGIA